MSPESLHDKLTGTLDSGLRNSIEVVAKKGPLHEPTTVPLSYSPEDWTPEQALHHAVARFLYTIEEEEEAKESFISELSSDSTTFFKFLSELIQQSLSSGVSIASLAGAIIAGVIFYDGKRAQNNSAIISTHLFEYMVNCHRHGKEEAGQILNRRIHQNSFIYDGETKQLDENISVEAVRNTIIEYRNACVNRRKSLASHISNEFNLFREVIEEDISDPLLISASQTMQYVMPTQWGGELLSYLIYKNNSKSPKSLLSRSFEYAAQVPARLENEIDGKLDQLSYKYKWLYNFLHSRDANPEGRKFLTDFAFDLGASALNPARWRLHYAKDILHNSPEYKAIQSRYRKTKNQLKKQKVASQNTPLYQNMRQRVQKASKSLNKLCEDTAVFRPIKPTAKICATFIRIISTQWAVNLYKSRELLREAENGFRDLSILALHFRFFSNQARSHYKAKNSPDLIKGLTNIEAINQRAEDSLIYKEFFRMGVALAKLSACTYALQAIFQGAHASLIPVEMSEAHYVGAAISMHAVLTALNPLAHLGKSFSSLLAKLETRKARQINELRQAVENGPPDDLNLASPPSP